MERNDSGTAGEFSGNGNAQGNDFDFPSSSSTGATQDQGLKDRAVNAMGNARERLADVGSTMKEKASNAKEKLADALESGAERLRERAGTTGGATLAGATGEGTTAIPADGRVAQVSDKVASGMQSTADWIREADIADLKQGIEKQVKEHPGRTLLIAVGLGYLVGRAFRSNQ